jgi:hypothetical protein
MPGPAKGPCPQSPNNHPCSAAQIIDRVNAGGITRRSLHYHSFNMCAGWFYGVKWGEVCE